MQWATSKSSKISASHEAEVERLVKLFNDFARVSTHNLYRIKMVIISESPNQRTGATRLVPKLRSSLPSEVSRNEVRPEIKEVAMLTFAGPAGGDI
jgi:hypothetical protein